MIRVYDSNEKLFNNNGIKILHPLMAEIYKKDNSDYYVELEDTIDNLEYYQKEMIIRIPTPWGIQGFRCDNPKRKNHRIKCKAWHLSYDAKNYIIKDAYSVDKNCNNALEHFNKATDRISPFSTISDITTILSMRGVRKTLFDIYTEMISADKYGGHWYRDNFTLGIKQKIGEDRGVVLAQNKNITDIEVSEEWDNVCTKILPYTTDGEVAIELEEVYVELQEEIYDTTYAKTIKFDNVYAKEDFETEEAFLTATKAWLRTQAEKYIEENKLPKINYSVSAEIDNVSDVGDIIYVKHPKCKVDITTEVISVVYDAIRQKYKKIEFGNFKKEIKNLSQEITAEANKYSDSLVKENTGLLHEELNKATAEINAVLGNSYAICNGNEVLFVDKLPKEEAVYCIKINSAGIGFSSNGIYGTFTSAWTIDGTLNMQAINVINLTASLIKGGVLKLGGVNNTSGIFELYDDSNNRIMVQDRTGITVYALDGTFVKLNAEVGFAGFDKNGGKSYWADGNVFHMYNAEIENEASFAKLIKLVPVKTTSNTGIGFAAVAN